MPATTDSRGLHMTDTQGILKAALVMAGVLAAIGLIVGLTLRHHIGGFIRTVEREAQEQAEAEEAAHINEKKQGTDEDLPGAAGASSADRSIARK